VEFWPSLAAGAMASAWLASDRSRRWL